jgi:hypothetical protein
LGRTHEAAHFGGYAIGRMLSGIDDLLEDNRWALVGYKSVEDFLSSVRMEALKPYKELRPKLVAKIKKADPTLSLRRIGTLLGVSHTSVSNALTEEAEKPNDASEPVSSEFTPDDGMQANAAAERAKKKAAAAEASKAKRESSRQATPLADGMELRIGDCRKVLEDVPDSSVPLILTDPAYGDEAERLYRWLAEWSARVLIPGGSLICSTGQSRLNRDIKIFDEHLRYWWQLIMPHDQSQRLAGKFVIANYKPVLWYVKDFRRGRSLLPDVLKSPARDKSLHNWSQGDGGVSSIIEHLTDPGELIVDPFAGTAAWGRAAVGMGRRWLGADIEDGGTERVEAAE